MRLSDKQINKLKELLEQEFGLMYTDEQAQHAGLAIMRFVLAKERRVGRRTNEQHNLRIKKDE